MSTFIATTTATSSLTARGIRPALLSSTTPLKFFSTTRTLLTTNPTTNPTPNPSYPKFSLKRISPNPRVRMALGAGLVCSISFVHSSLVWAGRVRIEPSFINMVGVGCHGCGRGVCVGQVLAQDFWEVEGGV